MKHREMDQEPFEQQSLKNLVHFYRNEIYDVHDGKSIYKKMSYGVRKRLIANNIIFKGFRTGYGCRYFLTSLGKEMLNDEC